MKDKVLVVNPGSTSTKIALYENENRVFAENIEHPTEDLNGFDDILEQKGYRAEAIHSFLSRNNIEPSELMAVAGRGGLLLGMESGGYLVTEEMTLAIQQGRVAANHASNLGPLIAYEIAKPLGIDAYIYDAVTANEFPEIAIVTGIPEVRKQSMCHVLNMKAMSRKVAKNKGRAYEDLRLIVVHLGGGVSVSAHIGGRIVDAIGDDSGPYFAPERSGGVPIMNIVDMCFSGKYTKKEIAVKIRGKGGLSAYFGTSDCRAVEKMIADGDEKAKLMYEAMAYQIAKGIGQLSPVLSGKIDYVILTGGLANSKLLTGMIKEYVDWIAPVVIEPGEDEMEALALGALRIAKGEEKAKAYQAQAEGETTA
ncbi:MAG: butyrate kinase [Clostridiales bacterium]|nr:butyrate kinase [Clostridiales bacterium]